MEQTLLLIVIILIFILVVLIAALTVIGLRFLQLKGGQKVITTEDVVEHETLEKISKDHYKKIPPEVLKSLRANPKYQDQSAYCVDHESEISAGICSLSGDSYCEHCLTTFNNMKFSKKFLDLYLSSDWPELKTIAEIASNKDKIERVYKAKKELWINKALPIIVQGQYKINIDTDEIESFVVILVREEDKNIVENELAFLNK